MNSPYARITLYFVTLIILIGCTSTPTPTPTLRPTQTPTESPTDTPTPSPTATTAATLEAVALVGDAVRGQQLFQLGHDPAPACINCHALETQGYMLGPVISGITERAANRVEGLSAQEYILQSILEPGAYLVGGYRNLMYSEYGTYLSAQDLADLVAYLETL